MIIDNSHCNPGNWNNHGAIVQFKGKSDVFYHRSSQGVVMMRRACVEPITFREDGSIPEVEMTTQGAGAPLDSSLRIEAEQACGLWGNVRVSTGGENTEILSGIHDGDRALYKFLDFKSAPMHLRMRVKSRKFNARINVHLNQNTSSKIAGIDIKGTPDGKWTEVVCEVSQASGVHAVEFNFGVQGEDGPLLEWWRFE